MRREDREAMRGKTKEGRQSGREDNATPEFDRMKREQMRGSSTSSDQQKPRPERPAGRLPLPD